ncbi:DUF3888 domain-containing protein [Alkalihalobacillus macyae]|uniref:DUF3888 domain-containing protein n=1 Tax=Guptibacillus hwajinpoensis TaxID=208199 RepID=UPI00273BE472|nr:DUF3888 domain-containing protein [Alkalihalobacillus macyae]MDP4552343.1 DUF3888 domain-containing protein [Alkalihalobacillus macyae]
MTRLLISFVVCLLLWNLSFSNQVIAESNIESMEKHSDFYDALLVLLDPYTRKVINQKYPNRSYALWNAEILEVKRKTEGYSQYDFIIKVRYDTFTGAFNPPEGPVTITFDVKLEGVTVTSIKG